MLRAKWVELIDKYKFVETALDKAVEMFLVYVAGLEALMSIIKENFTRESLLGALEQDKILIEISID